MKHTKPKRKGKALPGVGSSGLVRRRVGITDDQLCKMIREVAKDRPDLDPNNKMRLTRTEMLDGKPVNCYIET